MRGLAMKRSALQTLGFRDLPDEATLRARYRELLFAHHPDLRGQQSTQRASQIIQAYRLLQGAARTRSTGVPGNAGKVRRNVTGGAAGSGGSASGRPVVAPAASFQLLRGAFGNIALPIRVVEGFVRARDASIDDDRFRAVARHGGRSYVLFSPGGKRVSAKAPVHWLLLLRTQEGSALAFRDRPESNFIVPDSDTLLLHSPEGPGTIMVGGITFQIPPIPGIEMQTRW